MPSGPSPNPAIIGDGYMVPPTVINSDQIVVLDQIAEKLPLGFLLHGKASEIILNNALALEYLGLTKDQLLGKTSFDPDWNVIHQDGSDFPGDTHPVPTVIKTKKAVSNVMMGVYRPANKDRIWLNVDASPLLNHVGEVEYVICTFHDITHHIETEKTLADIFNWSPIPMLITSLMDGKVYQTNKKLHQISGFKPDEIEGHLTENFFAYPVDRQKVLQEYATKGYVENLEVQLRTKQGDIVDALISSNLIRMQGKELSLSGFVDITERNRIARELEQSENNLSTLLDNTDTGYALIGVDFRVKSFNKKMVQMVKDELQHDLVVDSEFYQYFSEPRKQAISDIANKILQGETVQYEIKYERADHSERWYHTKFFPVRDNKKNAFGFIMAMEDVTKRKNAEYDLDRTVQLMTDQNKRLLNFSYIVSHNLRSHTSSIKSIIRILENVKSEQERKEFMNHLYSVSEALDTTLLNLNEVVSIHNNLNIATEMLDLYEYTIRAIALLKTEIESKNAVVQNNVPRGTMVKYNPAYLESVVLNFISNAVKYSSPDRLPEISIDCYHEKEMTVLKISDNGIGIDMKRHGSKLFGMYKTFHGNKDARGIGLFITKNQVEAMHGKIEVTSEPDKGTIFKIYFA